MASPSMVKKAPSTAAWASLFPAVSWMAASAAMASSAWIFQRSPLGQEQPDGVSQHGEEGAEHRCLGVALPRGELDGGQCGDGQKRLTGRPGARLHPTTP